MIKNTIKNAEEEYQQDGIKYKLLVSHVPFTFKKREPKFDIERELFSNWSALISENIKPDIMLCGHTHKACVSKPGSEYDDLGHPCTVIVGSDLKKDEQENVILAGALITLGDGKAKVTVNSETEVLLEETVVFE